MRMRCCCEFLKICTVFIVICRNRAKVPRMTSASDPSLSSSCIGPTSGDHDAKQSIHNSTNRFPEPELADAATSNVDEDERNGITIGEPNEDGQDDDDSCDFAGVESHEVMTTDDKAVDET